MNIDDQLRDVYADLALRAPNADRVRAGIAGRANALRQRRLLLAIGGTAAAAAALGVPALLLTKDPTPIDAMLRPVRGRGYPMPFTPSWIPDGFKLTERRVTTGVPGPQRRVWQLNPPMKFPEIAVNLALGGFTPPASNVDVNGVSATLRQEKHVASCSWQPITGVEIKVTLQKQPDEIDSGPEYAEIVQRIARSANPGRVEYLLPTMSFGWLPDHVELRRIFARFYDRDDHVDVILASAAEAGTVISATVVDKLPEDVNLAEMEKTMVRGRPAWYTPPQPQAVYQGPGHFVVELADGTWLSAGGDSAAAFTITKADLVRVIDAIQLE